MIPTAKAASRITPISVSIARNGSARAFFFGVDGKTGWFGFSGLDSGRFRDLKGWENADLRRTAPHCKASADRYI
jgi:hypothetical protein